MRAPCLRASVSRAARSHAAPDTLSGGAGHSLSGQQMDCLPRPRARVLTWPAHKNVASDSIDCFSNYRTDVCKLHYFQTGTGLVRPASARASPRTTPRRTATTAPRTSCPAPLPHITTTTQTQTHAACGKLGPQCSAVRVLSATAKEGKRRVEQRAVDTFHGVVRGSALSLCLTRRATRSTSTSSTYTRTYSSSLWVRRLAGRANLLCAPRSTQPARPPHLLLTPRRVRPPRDLRRQGMLGVIGA